MYTNFVLAGSAVCPTGFTAPYKGHCYLFSQEELSWHDASMKCKQLQANLVSIETEGEQYHLVLNLHRARCQRDEERIRLQQPLSKGNICAT